MHKILVFPISLLIAILACMRAMINALFGSQRIAETTSDHPQNNMTAPNNVEQKTAEVTRAAQSLEQAHEHYIRRFQTLYFKIETIRLRAYDRVELVVSDVAGGSHHWWAEIDESGIVICDESMPDSLLHAIRKTENPSSTLSELMRLIQAEVDIQMPTLHRVNLRRLLAIPDLEEISINQQLGFAE